MNFLEGKTDKKIRLKSSGGHNLTNQTPLALFEAMLVLDVFSN